MFVESKDFGTGRTGERATRYCFRNQAGMQMEVSDFGATLCALWVPDAAGNLRDVVLGYDNPAGYEGPSATFFGATVGRNANRIGKARFCLNGQEYRLEANNGQNNLHSGSDRYDLRLWQVKEIGEQGITFSLYSPDGDQGFPGGLALEVTYTLGEDNRIQIDYRGIPEQDTIVNLTNHSYFNLDGHDSGSIEEHRVWVDADFFTRADAESIPTGELVPVAGTPMDFREMKQVGRDIGEPYEALVFGKGYDHNWCLNNGGQYGLVARLEGAHGGIAMEVYTDRPGVQIYTGNFIDREPGKNGAVYPFRGGICFETQGYPDAPNHSNFPSTVCRAGEVYQTTTAYRFVLRDKP